MYASRVTCITRHELDGQYQNSEDGIPAPFLGQQLDVGEDMLGFFARWKGVVAALALSSKALFGCTDSLFGLFTVATVNGPVKTPSRTGCKKRLHRCSILLKERNIHETQGNH